jgi:hypothetical protein
MRWNGSRAALAALALAMAPACGSPGTVSLSAKLSNPELQVEELALGQRLKGGFDLTLEVGPEATDASEVSIESFAVLRELTTVIAPLLAVPEVTFPLRVGKGERRIVHFTLDDSKFIETTERDAVCAGGVRITGVIRDTLSGGNVTNLSTAVFEPRCP